MASTEQNAEQARQAQDVDAIPTLAWSARPDGSAELATGGRGGVLAHGKPHEPLPGIPVEVIGTFGMAFLCVVNDDGIRLDSPVPGDDDWAIAQPTAGFDALGDADNAVHGCSTVLISL